MCAAFCLEDCHGTVKGKQAPFPNHPPPMLLERVLAESALSAPSGSLGRRNSQPPCSTAVPFSPGPPCALSLLCLQEQPMHYSIPGLGGPISFLGHKDEARAKLLKDILSILPLCSHLQNIPEMLQRCSPSLTFHLAGELTSPMPLLPQVYHSCQGVPVCWEGRGCCSPALVLLAHGREGKHLYKAPFVANMMKV